jgi:hypothetical protein
MDYDVTAGAFQTSNGGSVDVFVTEFDFMPVSIENSNIMSLQNFELYPNPSTGTFTVESQNIQNTVFELTDISGKVLNTYIMQGTNRLDIQVHVPAGMYFIRERKTDVIQKLIITE